MTNDHISTFVRECQVFAGHVVSARAGAAHRALVDEFVSRLPTPDHPLETLVMDGLLFKIAAQWSHHLHEQLHVDSAIPCEFNSDADLVPWRNRHSSAGTFADWATTFLDRSNNASSAATLQVKRSSIAASTIG
jgi:hypothetical protein